MGRWVYKSKTVYEQDIKKERSSLGWALFYSITTFLFLLLDGFTGFIREELYPVKTINTWNDFFEFSPLIFGIPIALFFGIILYRKFVNKDMLVQDSAVICDRCGDVKMPDGVIRCRCLGKYVDLKQMKWVEDEIIVAENSEENPKINIEEFDLDFRREKFCKFHPGKSSKTYCAFCLQPLCNVCFNKFRLNIERKKIGFCDLTCQSQYLKKRRIVSGKNMKKSLILIPFILGFIFLGYNSSGITDVWIYHGITFFFTIWFLRGLIFGKSV